MRQKMKIHEVKYLRVFVVQAISIRPRFFNEIVTFFEYQNEPN